MITHTIRADRLADLALRIVAAVNMLFLAALVLTLILATSQAHASSPVCTGTDLLAELRQDDPALYAEVRAESAQTENGESLFWRVEPPEGPPSHLFGTMHVTDPRVLDLPETVEEALDGARTVVIESTDILDQSAMLAAMAANPELTMFTDSTTLRSLIPTDDLEMVETALRVRGIPLSSVNRTKPWLVSALLALPACEFDRQAAGNRILDIMLAERARDAGKRVAGLETMADQLGAMAALPMDLHIEGLVEVLRLGDRVEDVLETMVQIYLSGETGMFWPLFRAVLPSGEDGTAGYGEFERIMVVARNHSMVKHALPLLDEGGAFIAVGALHLPGPEGLVALLRQEGYTLTALSR